MLSMVGMNRLHLDHDVIMYLVYMEEPSGQWSRNRSNKSIPVYSCQIIIHGN